MRCTSTGHTLLPAPLFAAILLGATAHPTYRYMHYADRTHQICDWTGSTIRKIKVPYTYNGITVFLAYNTATDLDVCNKTCKFDIEAPKDFELIGVMEVMSLRKDVDGDCLDYVTLGERMNSIIDGGGPWCGRSSQIPTNVLFRSGIVQSKNAGMVYNTREGLIRVTLKIGPEFISHLHSMPFVTLRIAFTSYQGCSYVRVPSNHYVHCRRSDVYCINSNLNICPGSPAVQLTKKPRDYQHLILPLLTIAVAISTIVGFFALLMLVRDGLPRQIVSDQTPELRSRVREMIANRRLRRIMSQSQQSQQSQQEPNPPPHPPPQRQSEEVQAAYQNQVRVALPPEQIMPIDRLRLCVREVIANRRSQNVPRDQCYETRADDIRVQFNRMNNLTVAMTPESPLPIESDDIVESPPPSYAQVMIGDHPPLYESLFPNAFSSRPSRQSL